MTRFTDFELPEALQDSLKRMNFETPTPIQAAAIPPALEGRDVMGTAQTGTGKTAAFAVPLVSNLLANPTNVALVLTPTRELAMQVMQVIRDMQPAKNALQSVLLIGGEPIVKQFRQLRTPPRIVVGTPGRVLDHLTRGTLALHEARFLVLDETDRMLDMGFSIQLQKIMKHLPKHRQTLMFSATMPAEIRKLSTTYLKNPEQVAIGNANAAAPKVKQELIKVSEEGKYAELVKQLNTREGSIIVFVKTKWGTEKLAQRLSRDKYAAEPIHGDLKQSRRDRVIRSFRNEEFRILVATDVAARGLDIPHIQHVINHDLPQCAEDYIHRIGRTARASAEGSAVSLIAPDDASKWRAIHRLMNPGLKCEHFGDAPPKGTYNRRPNGFTAKAGKRPFQYRGARAGDHRKSA